MIKGVTQEPYIGIELHQDTKRKIEEYILSKVHSQCKKNEWFFFKDIFGKENSDWRGTSLQPIFEYYYNIEKGQEEDRTQKAMNNARKIGGLFLKKVLYTDQRVYEQGDEIRQERNNSFTVLKYMWVDE